MLRRILPLTLPCSARVPARAGPGRTARPAVSASIRKIASVEGITEYGCPMPQGAAVPRRLAGHITVNVTYLVGSRHEGYGESGMAHLLEHMLFKGTPRHANQNEFQRYGAASTATSFDRTNYYETFAANEKNLDGPLGLEADRMVNSYVAKKDLDSEIP